jgi:hypothetical protein
MTAIDAMSDLYSTLPDSAAANRVDESRLNDKVPSSTTAVC